MRTFLAILVLLAGCRRECTGEMEPFDPDDPGRYPVDLNAWLARVGDLDGTWTWPDGSTTPAHMTLRRTGAAARTHYQNQCPDNLWIRSAADASVRTEDGKLDEAGTVRLELWWKEPFPDDPVDLDVVRIEVPLDAMGGSLRPTSYDPEYSSYDTLTLLWRPDETRWRVTGGWALYIPSARSDPPRPDTGAIDTGECEGCYEAAGEGIFPWSEAQ